MLLPPLQPSTVAPRIGHSLPLAVRPCGVDAVTPQQEQRRPKQLRFVPAADVCHEFDPTATVASCSTASTPLLVGDRWTPQPSCRALPTKRTPAARILHSSMQRVADRRKAAMVIQGAVRHWLQRSHTRLAYLQQQLERIEARKTAELVAIAKHRRAQVDRWTHQRDDHAAHQEATLAQAHAIADGLRRANKRLRAKNETLAQAIDVIRVDNQVLTKQLQSTQRKMEAATAKIRQLTAENAQWQDVVDQMEVRRGEFETSLARLQEHVDFESLVGFLHKESTRHMIDLVQASSQSRKHQTLVHQLKDHLAATEGLVQG